jgi:hypothetical protein
MSLYLQGKIKSKLIYKISDIDKMSDELEYLRFIYKNLDMDMRIKYQKLFPGIPPDDYNLTLCEMCNKNIAHFSCNICNKSTCLYCTNGCSVSSRLMCKEHFHFCSICRINCSCIFCRKYNPDNICDTCSENFGSSYSCADCSGKENSCVYCKNEMEPIINLRKRKINDSPDQ